MGLHEWAHVQSNGNLLQSSENYHVVIGFCERHSRMLHGLMRLVIFTYFPDIFKVLITTNLLHGDVNVTSCNNLLPVVDVS